jgi:NAD(P)-dependent dehydrogenase (short-subunit alcohol dehydrogenase family)
MKTKTGMKGKKVLITGSGTGIGRGTALAFIEQGADVVLHYAHSETGAAEVVAKAKKSGAKAKAIKANFTNVEEVQGLGNEAVNFLGGLDILINNAGITMTAPFEEVTVDQFDTLYQVNVRSQFFLTQKALPSLKKSGNGVIINITSIHAFRGLNEHSVYAGTKGAIAAYTRELAIELAPKGIRVNAIAPGAVAVENHYKAINDYNPEAVGKLIPAGFEGVPEDIANIAVFLSSDEARYIVGQTLVADGGTTSWLALNDGFKKKPEGRFGKGYVSGI